MHSLLAYCSGCVWASVAKMVQHTGIPMPQMTDQAGLAVLIKLYHVQHGTHPDFGITGSHSSLVVSYLPARKKLRK
jgi:hypothetical protein